MKTFYPALLDHNKRYFKNSKGKTTNVYKNQTKKHNTIGESTGSRY